MSKNMKAVARGTYKWRVLIAIIMVILLATSAVLWWVTFTVFDYQLRSVVIFAGQGVNTQEFLYPSEEMQGVSAEFLQLPDLGPGRHDVSLLLRRGLRSLETFATLYVLQPREYVIIEFAETEQYLEPLDFFANASIVRHLPMDIQFQLTLPSLETLSVGETPVTIGILDGYRTRIVQLEITIIDTTPPTAVVVNLTMPKGEDTVAEDFLTDVFDASGIARIAFTSEVGTLTPGDHVLEIMVEDVFGNYALFYPTLTIKSNDTPPTLTGTRNLEVMMGTAVMFRYGVSAYDAFDRPLRFEVDSGELNTNVPGIYYVTYWVEDAWGLRTEAEIRVYIIDVDPEAVYARVDEILARILHDDMTQVQEARAIFNWVSTNVAFVGGVSRDSVYEGAWQALTNRRGNCFVFYAISEVMLTRAGIPNMRIDRIPGQRTNHRWNLINPDDMGWYHFDTTPQSRDVPLDRFMFTSGQARDFTARMLRAQNRPNYFTYDPSLYPDIVQ